MDWPDINIRDLRLHFIGAQPFGPLNALDMLPGVVPKRALAPIVGDWGHDEFLITEDALDK
jgi:hypothetical protein